MTKLTNHYSAVNPALRTLRSHEAETPVSPFRAADEDSDERAMRDEDPLAAMRNKRRREDQHLRQTVALVSDKRRQTKDTTEQRLTTLKSSMDAAYERTATDRPRLLSPGPALRRGQRRAGHASSLPGRRLRSAPVEVQQKVLWLPCVASGVVKTNITQRRERRGQRRVGHASSLPGRRFNEDSDERARQERQRAIPRQQYASVRRLVNGLAGKGHHGSHG